MNAKMTKFASAVDFFPYVHYVSPIVQMERIYH